MEDNQITDNDKEDDKQDRIELVQRAVEGDKEAFTNLYTLTYSEVYHIVKVFIHNEDTAQDIVQETYYKSLRKIKQLKEPDKFPVWIKKIAVNTAKAHLRKVDWVLFSEADGEGGKSIAELEKKGVILRTAAPDSHVSVSETSGSSGTDTEGEVPGESGDRKSDCHRNCSSSDLYGNRDRCCENSGQASAGAGDTGAAGGYR